MGHLLGAPPLWGEAAPASSKSSLLLLGVQVLGQRIWWPGLVTISPLTPAQQLVPPREQVIDTFPKGKSAVIKKGGGKGWYRKTLCQPHFPTG
jgi:hypothetical protein